MQYVAELNASMVPARAAPVHLKCARNTAVHVEAVESMSCPQIASLASYNLQLLLFRIFVILDRLHLVRVEDVPHHQTTKTLREH
jgi:hypothetical protein